MMTAIISQRTDNLFLKLLLRRRALSLLLLLHENARNCLGPEPGRKSFHIHQKRIRVLPESIHDVIFDEGQLGVNLEHP